MKIDSITFDVSKDCFCFTLSSGRKLLISYPAYMALDLHKDHELSDDERQALEDENAHLRAYLIGSRYANYQPRTEHEVRMRLQREELPSPEIDKVVAKLERQHLLDDEAYAFRYAEDKQSIRGWSKREIAQHLYQKGVSSEIVKRAVDSLNDDAEEEALEKLFQKKYARRDLTDQKEYQKTFAALARHGFSASAIQSLLRREREK